MRGAINVVEACAQTDTIQKIVFTSSLAAAIWRENICSEKDVDERCWSDQHFCRKMKVFNFTSLCFQVHSSLHLFFLKVWSFFFSIFYIKLIKEFVYRCVLLHLACYHLTNPNYNTVYKLHVNWLARFLSLHFWGKIVNIKDYLLINLKKKSKTMTIWKKEMWSTAKC